MGSWDPVPEGFYEFGDGIWMPPHEIVCRSDWNGQDKHSHRTVEEVHACYRAKHDVAKGIEVWACGWLMEGRYDDGSKFTYPCEAPTRYVGGRGSFECAAGHDHVPAEVRYEQGWDYASDEEEAHYLRSHGIDAVAMNGGSI